MHKRFEEKHQSNDKDKRIVNHPDASDPRTVAVVRQFRTRAQLAQISLEKQKNDTVEWCEDYMKKIFLSYQLGDSNLDDESRQYFNNALCIFGETLAILNQDQEYSKKIYATNVNNLNITEQFQRTILCFILDMDDLLNIRQMKIFIKRAKDARGGDEDELGDLLDYIDEILAATRILIAQGQLDVNMDFYFMNNLI